MHTHSHVRTEQLSTGEFRIISPQLVADLTKTNNWNEATRAEILRNNGNS